MKTRHERIKEMIEKIKEVSEEPCWHSRARYGGAILHPNNERVHLARHLLKILNGEK
jgi:hypothetical protein